MDKPHVVTIKEYYVAGNVPESNVISTGNIPMIETLKDSNLARVTEVYPDAHFMINQNKKYKYSGDIDLINLCRNDIPDLIVFDPIVRNPDFPANPRPMTLAYIAWKMNIKISAVAWDGGPSSIAMYDNIYPMIEHIAISDNFNPSKCTYNISKWKWDWWFPANMKYTNDPGYVRDIDVSIPGRVGAGPRLNMVNELKDRGIDIFYISLDENANHNLPTEKFYDIHKRSKIVLSETGSGRLKWRAFEGIACGALLLEPEVTNLSDYFIPNKEYVTYKTSPITPTWDTLVIDYDDVAKVIKYYLSHEDERKEIAKAGHKHLCESYTGTTWWEKYLKFTGTIS